MSDISVHQSDGLWKKNPIEVYYIGTDNTVHLEIKKHSSRSTRCDI